MAIFNQPTVTKQEKNLLCREEIESACKEAGLNQIIALCDYSRNDMISGDVIRNELRIFLEKLDFRGLCGVHGWPRYHDHPNMNGMLKIVANYRKRKRELNSIIQRYSEQLGFRMVAGYESTCDRFYLEMKNISRQEACSVLKKILDEAQNAGNRMK